MSNVKALIPCLFWSVALLGMNSVYANETSILETVTTVEAGTIDLENTWVTPSQEEQRKTSQIDVSAKPPTQSPVIGANDDVINSLDISENSEMTESTSPQSIDIQENNQQENLPKKQRKTHYGIGYEFRNTLRKAEKQQQNEHDKPAEKIQRVERAEKAQRFERIERPERVERSERITRPERHHR